MSATALAAMTRIATNVTMPTTNDRSRRDRAEQQATDAGDPEDALDDDQAGRQLREVRREERRHRDEAPLPMLTMFATQLRLRAPALYEAFQSKEQGVVKLLLRP